MIDKIAYMTEAEWVALLDEIRKKGGTTDKMTAEQAKQAVEALKIGGEDNLKKMLKGELEEVSYDDITSIPNYAFKDNSFLVKVNFPNVNTIDSGAFKNCIKLRSVNIPKVTELNQDVFKSCKNLDLSCFKNIKEISYGSLSYIGTNLSPIDFFEFPNLTLVRSSALAGYSYSKRLSLPSLTRIYGSEVISYGNVLEECSIPKVNKLDEGFFRKQTALKKVIINKNLVIEERAFLGCGFTDIDLKDGVNINGENVFAINEQLKYIKIKCKSTSGLKGTFSSCGNIRKIWISSSAEFNVNKNDRSDYPFFRTNKTAEIYTDGDDIKKFGYVNICNEYDYKFTVHTGVTEEQFNEICKADNGGVEVPFDGIIYVDDNGNEVK